MTMARAEHQEHATPQEGGPAQVSRVAREAAEALFELIHSQKSRFDQAASMVGLTSPQAAVLWHLDPKHPMSMGSLAEQMHCDASNITAMVDKLESRGLLLRQASSEDRRVKLLAVTGDGTQAREAFLAHIREPAPWLLALDAEDQMLLRDLLRRALERIERPEAKKSGH